jgi:serine/threonine protein kinase
MHRDLKPANILVVELDGKATPRIIDFGLAKELDHRLATKPHLLRPEAGSGPPVT